MLHFSRQSHLRWDGLQLKMMVFQQRHLIRPPRWIMRQLLWQSWRDVYRLQIMTKTRFTMISYLINLAYDSFLGYEWTGDRLLCSQIITYSGAYPFSISGLQSAVRSAKIGSFWCPFVYKRTKKWIKSTRTRIYSGAYPFTLKSWEWNGDFSGAYPFIFSQTTSKTMLFRRISVHSTAWHTLKSCVNRLFSGAYPFTFTGSSVIFVLDLTIEPVRQWQEQ